MEDSNLFKAFSKKKILVLGDVMLDRYWWGDVSRISPEAPVPVVRLRRTSVAAGGAANVAANIAGLGATPILIGAVGNDGEAGIVRSVLSESGVSPENLVTLENYPTTVKTRVIAHSQQVVRVDHELHEILNSEEEAKIIESVRAKIAESDAVVISDYAKGLLTDALISETVSVANSAGKTILVDPKGKHFGKYDRATLLTPNLHEAKDACKLDGDGDGLAIEAGSRLLSDFSFSAVLITQGDAGMTLFQRDTDPLHFSAIAKEVYDVTGAGDTVIATLATSLGAGSDLASACRLANIAAGIVVEQVGTTPIRIKELEKASRAI
jgi:D-beta-D-heptose 7-phosphate kinase/D-beta-D-heptose 1-phosphate adenosyltransferase